MDLLPDITICMKQLFYLEKVINTHICIRFKQHTDHTVQEEVQIP